MNNKVVWSGLLISLMLAVLAFSVAISPISSSVVAAPEATRPIIPLNTPIPIGFPDRGAVATNRQWDTIIQTFNTVDMVLVPMGCFMMGSDDGYRNEAPAHEQCFDVPFWIDRYEVSNDQFDAFNGQSEFTSYWGDPDRPRDAISWIEARDFCELRGVRLPTEREWEYAARGVDNLEYPWGNEFIGRNVVYRETDDATDEIGERPGGVSWAGAEDMSGNVAEWVSSQLAPYPYVATDGREELTYEFTPRVQRGGSWNQAEANMRSAYRNSNSPRTSSNFFGFRCARDWQPGEGYRE